METEELEDTFRYYSLHCGGIIFFHDGVPKDLVLNNWDKVKPKTRWGYPRLTKKETKDLLEWKN